MKSLHAHAVSYSTLCGLQLFTCVQFGTAVQTLCSADMHMCIWITSVQRNIPFTIRPVSLNTSCNHKHIRSGFVSSKNSVPYIQVGKAAFLVMYTLPIIHLLQEVLLGQDYEHLMCILCLHTICTSVAYLFQAVHMPLGLKLHMAIFKNSNMQ